jgi:hypothetical protein
MDVEMRDARGNSPSGGNLNHPNLLGNGPSADPNRADPGSNKSAADDLLAMFSSLSEEEKRKALQRVQQAAGNVSQDSKIAEMEARLAQLEAGRALEGGSQGNKPAVSGGKVVEKVVLDDLQYPKSNSAFQSAPASHMHATAKAMKAPIMWIDDAQGTRRADTFLREVEHYAWVQGAQKEIILPSYMGSQVRDLYEQQVKDWNAKALK